MQPFPSPDTAFPVVYPVFGRLNTGWTSGVLSQIAVLTGAFAPSIMYRGKFGKVFLRINAHQPAAGVFVVFEVLDAVGRVAGENEIFLVSARPLLCGAS